MFLYFTLFILAYQHARRPENFVVEPIPRLDHFHDGPRRLGVRRDLGERLGDGRVERVAGRERYLRDSPLFQDILELGADEIHPFFRRPALFERAEAEIEIIQHGDEVADQLFAPIPRKLFEAAVFFFFIVDEIGFRALPSREVFIAESLRFGKFFFESAGGAARRSAVRRVPAVARIRASLHIFILFVRHAYFLILQIFEYPDSLPVIHPLRPDGKDGNGRAPDPIIPADHGKIFAFCHGAFLSDKNPRAVPQPLRRARRTPVNLFEIADNRAELVPVFPFKTIDKGLEPRLIYRFARKIGDHAENPQFFRKLSREIRPCALLQESPQGPLARIVRRGRAEQAIRKKFITGIGRHAARRMMGLREISSLLERIQLEADHRRLNAEFIVVEKPAGTHRFARGDESLDCGLQDLRRPFVHAVYYRGVSSPVKRVPIGNVRKNPDGHGKMEPMTSERNKHVRWIDVPRPRGADLAWLKKEFSLHPVIAEELAGPSARARVEAYDGYLYFVHYFPKYDEAEGATIRTEIDFIVTKDAVATIHYEPVTKALDTFKLDDEKNSLALLCRLFAHLTAFEERELRHIREKVEAVGRGIFRNHERELLEQIASLKRDVSEYRIIVRLQEPVFQSLTAKGTAFWGRGAEIYLEDLAGEHLKVAHQIQDYSDAVTDFEHTNNQLMNLKINSAMRTFTALSFLTFPFVLIAAIFGMRVADVPLTATPGAFWIIVGAMAACIIALFIYFRRKEWF